MFYWFIYTAAMLLAHLLFRIKVSGKEHLNACEGQKFIICSNHIHFIDPVIVAVQRFARRRAVIIAKVELFKHPLASWFFHKLNVVPVDRGKGDTDTLDEVQRKMEEGSPLLIFPEGTRSKDGKLLPLKSGALFIAAATGATIVPCSVSLCGKKRLRPFIGKYHIRFGEPLTPQMLGMDPENRRTFRAAKQKLTQTLMDLADEC